MSIRVIKQSFLKEIQGAINNADFKGQEKYKGSTFELITIIDGPKAEDLEGGDVDNLKKVYETRLIVINMKEA
ncbi:hypothetical protein [uncultured Pontibacter sp.]|uniref:hypothetical protein n=1 Tax=uncultured Pontibacter sp. TaxID=453356 RepID=UPI0026209483|nr:hypothetical protein [uncultured Pontibacter sp.]